MVLLRWLVIGDVDRHVECMGSLRNACRILIRKREKTGSLGDQHIVRETAIAQWLMCCVTNRKVAGSIPAVGGFFIDIKSFRSQYVPGVDSTSNRNEYEEYFLGVKAAGA